MRGRRTSTNDVSAFGSVLSRGTHLRVVLVLVLVGFGLLVGSIHRRDGGSFFGAHHHVAIAGNGVCMALRCTLVDGHPPRHVNRYVPCASIAPRRRPHEATIITHTLAHDKGMYDAGVSGSSGSSNTASSDANAFHATADPAPKEAARCAAESRRRQGRDAVAPEKVSACIDPRFPVPHAMLVVPLSVGVDVACYADNDIVCGNVARTGAWEHHLTDVIVRSLRGLRAHRQRQLDAYLEQVVARGLPGSSPHEARRLRRRMALRDVSAAPAAGSSSASNTSSQQRSATVTRDNFDVEYLDVGGNIGSFVYHVWRFGFPVRAFEPLAHNMQLLSTSMCLNGLRKPLQADVVNAFDDGAPLIVSAGPEQSPVSVVHTALGREQRTGCALFSDEANVGDTVVVCNGTTMQPLGKGGERYARRASNVNVTTLDAAFVDGAVSHFGSHRQGLVARINRDVLRMARTGGHPVGLNISRVLDEATPLLGDDFFVKDYVMKLDVEGGELDVLDGAAQLLRQPYRPRLLVTELWPSVDMRRLAHVMFDAGYVGYSLELHVALRTTEGIVKYLAARPRVDNILWVERRLAGVIQQAVNGKEVIRED